MAPTNAKRKREADGSDDEDISLGKQTLPVANLPENFDGEPMDGMQYLFTVRRDARRLPHVTRVPNPFAAPPPSIPQPSRSKPFSHPSIPSEQWCTLPETRFQNFKKNLNQATNHTHEPGKRLMPDKKERDLWRLFLEGRPEEEWNVNPKKSKKQQNAQGKRSGQGLRGWTDEPEQQAPTAVIIQESSLLNDEGEVEEALKPDPSELLPTPSGTPGPESTEVTREEDYEPPSPPPREPTMTLLKRINEPMALHLLMYFTHWINNHLQKPDQNLFPPRNSHARWMFVLLSRIDDHIGADDMNLLRNLARACLALLQHLITKELAPSTPETVMLPDAMSKQSCWMIVAIVVHVWKQRDLWMDVESMLARFPVTVI